MPKNSSTQPHKNSEDKFRNETLGDFTTTRRVISISALAMTIGYFANGTLAGVLTRKDIRDCINQDGNSALQRTLSEVARTNTSNVYSDEPLRVVVYRMAETGFTRMLVVDRASAKFLGLISLDDLLKARARHLEEERRRERTLKLRFLLPSGRLAEEEDISANS